MKKSAQTGPVSRRRDTEREPGKRPYSRMPIRGGSFLIEYKGISITARLSARAKIHRASDTSDSYTQRLLRVCGGGCIISSSR